MTNGLAQHIAVEESTSKQGVKTVLTQHVNEGTEIDNNHKKAFVYVLNPDSELLKTAE